MSAVSTTIDAPKNGPKEIMAYFSVPTRGIAGGAQVTVNGETHDVLPSDGKVSMAEYREFWTTLSDAEKEYFRTVALV